MFCYKCGREVSDDAKFCTGCGSVLKMDAQETKTATAHRKAGKGAAAPGKVVKDKMQGSMDHVTSAINHMAGGTGAVDLHVRDLFTDILKRHTTEEAEETFICGTATTTPDIAMVSSEWPKPWLYSRILVGMLIVYALMNLIVTTFNNTNGLPGLMMIGSFAMPLTVLIMFFELNVPRNISIYRTFSMFFIGGALSLIFTLVILRLLGSGENAAPIEALMTGLVEEAAKVLATAYFINKIKDKRYILNGILIGGAIGAGFAAFESAGYALSFYTKGLLRALANGAADQALSLALTVAKNVIVTRGMLAPGGHVVWAAITGAAIMIALKHREFSWSVFLDKRVIAFYLIVSVMHGIWDWSLAEIPVLNILDKDLPVIGLDPKHIILIVAAWIVLLVLIGRGLNEINQIVKAKQSEM